MKKIDELIRYYAQNEQRSEDTVICAKLKMIRSLSQSVVDARDELMVQEIVDSFSGIVELLQDEILQLYMEMECSATQGQFADPQPLTAQECRTDKQLQEAFTAWLARESKKPLSSYTINDYCSRVRNLWKACLSDYESGGLPDYIRIQTGELLPDAPLLNALRHTQQLWEYIQIMSGDPEEKRNWANVSAALNKFCAFAAHSVR